jgi:hypothetical protein
VRWTGYAGWVNVVAGIATGAAMVAVGLGIIGVLTGLAMVGSGVFMIWLAAGWDKPIEDLSTLHKYGRPANAIVLEVSEEALDGAGGRTAKLKLNVAPVNESDFIATRTLQLPGGRVPAVGETVTVKFDPQKRKNLILLEENYMVESPTAAAMRMVRGGPPMAALALLLVLALAAPANAEVTRMATGPTGIGVELAGSSVVFNSLGSPARIVRADPDGSAVVLRTYTPLGGNDDDECCSSFFTAGFSASATQVATSTFFEAYAKGMLAQSDYNLQAGPLKGSQSVLFQCQGNHPYDVDGDRIAYLGDDCTEKTSGQGSRVVTRNLAEPGTPVVGSFPMTRQPNTLDLAGDYVALSGFFGQQPEVVVHNTAGAEQYKLNHNFAEYSLQSDGKLALSQTEQLSSDCRIEWFSREQPTPHRIEFCPRGPIRMAGNRIAFDRREPGNAVVSLNLTTLDGQRQAYTVFDPASSLIGYDFDGARLAYGVRGCTRAQDTIWVDDLGTTGTDSPTVEGGPCTANVETKNARATSKGIVRLRVRCPEGCNASLSLYKGKSVMTRRPGTAVIAPGGVKTIPVKLSTLFDVRRKGSQVYSARVSVEQRGAQTRTFKRGVRVLKPK